MARLRVAIFGCGDHGRRLHAAGYAAMPDVEVVAAVDVDEERARAVARQYGTGAWFTDHREALAATNPELVSVVTPPVYHREQAVDALNAGAHVLCEKPLAMNASEAREMLAAAERNGKFLTMGLQYRHQASAAALRETLQAGTLGRIYYTRLWCGHEQIPGWGHFHRKALAGGGVVMATTVHFLDRALWVLGNPPARSVLACTYARLPRMSDPAVTWEGPADAYDVEDFAYAVVRFEDGSWMSLESNWLMHPTSRVWGVEILGDEGRAGLSPLLVEVARGLQVEDRTPRVEDDPDPVGVFLREAVRCAREGRDPLIRPHEMLQTQAIMVAIYRSAEAGVEVPVEA